MHLRTCQRNNCREIHPYRAGFSLDAQPKRTLAQYLELSSQMAGRKFKKVASHEK